MFKLSGLLSIFGLGTWCFWSVTGPMGGGQKMKHEKSMMPFVMMAKNRHGQRDNNLWMLIPATLSPRRCHGARF